MTWERNQMAALAAEELEDGMYVNLGIGIPTLVSNYVGNKDITLQSEIGVLGMGPFPLEGEENPDLINAGKQTVSELRRTSYFDSALSFGRIWGGKIATAILGAMDLVTGVGRVVVVMDHQSKTGESKLMRECTLPLTGAGVVDRIITILGVLDVVEGGLKVVETAVGVTEVELRATTKATIV